MLYHSTRSEEIFFGSEAILKGLCDDSGLFVPASFPKIDYKDVLDLKYPELAAKILSAYFDEFDPKEVEKETKEAYSVFDTDNVVEFKDFDNYSVLELFHGPTCAFKDLALVILPRMMKLAKKVRNDEATTTILTATSGDTGGATLSGFRGVDKIEVIVLYPKDGVSPLQEKQMLSFNNNNGHVFAVDANFDECQSFVKRFFNENDEFSLSSANSINISRLIAQIVYYYYSYIYLVRSGKIKEGEKIDFVVPTGNFGDILAGYMAKNMGLPVGKLCCASNENDVLTRFFDSKEYDATYGFKRTNSPSMDIVISSNLERLLYFETGNTRLVKKNMKRLAKKGRYHIVSPIRGFDAFFTYQKQTLDIIKKYYDEHSYLVDPHTAVALGAYENHKKISDNYTVVLSTAGPMKFPATVLEALGSKGETVDELSALTGEKVPDKLRYPDSPRTEVKLDELTDKIKETIRCFK